MKSSLLFTFAAAHKMSVKKEGGWDEPTTENRSRWDDSPNPEKTQKRKRRWDEKGETTKEDSTSRSSRGSWDETPKREDEGERSAKQMRTGDIPTPKRRSRWDETPVNIPAGAATPVAFGGATPLGDLT